MDRPPRLTGSWPRWLLIAALLATLAGALAIAGCGSTTTATTENNTVKIGLLPIAESLPFYVADSEGYFKEANVQVELVPFASAIERDAALQTGQIDAELNDPISALLLNKDKDDVRIVKVTYQASAQRPMITIFAGPNSTITTPADLKTAEIAISRNSVIEYVTDRLLASQDLDPNTVKKTEISKIPVRLEMLMNGQIGAASLPDPFAFLAQQQGAKAILDDGATGIGQSVLTVRQEVLSQRGAVVQRLLTAHARAVDTINANPEQYRSLLVDKAKVPAAIADSFPIPSFPTPTVPSQTAITDAENWMQAHGLLTRTVDYDKIVDASLIKQ